MKKQSIIVGVCLLVLMSSFMGVVNVKAYGSWDPYYYVSWNPPLVQDSQQPAIAVSNGFVHVAWSEEVPSVGRQIFYRKNTDFGESSGWDPLPPIQSTVFLHNSITPAIATWGPMVYLVFIDNTVHPLWNPYGVWMLYYTESNTLVSPVIWSIPMPLSNPLVNAYNPAIAAENDYVHIVFEGPTHAGNHVYYTRVQYGAQDIFPYQLNDINTEAESPTITAQLEYIDQNDERIYIAWSQRQPTSWEIYYCESPDHGLNWGNPQMLTPEDGFDSIAPSLASYRTQALSGPPRTYTVHCVWEDHLFYPYQICYMRIGEGISYPPTPISHAVVTHATSPSIADCGLGLAVVWEQIDPNSVFYHEIYLQFSEDNGYTWEPTDELVTDVISHSITPAISVDYRSDYNDYNYNHINLVWADNRLGFYTILYQRKYTDEVVSVAAKFSDNVFSPRMRTSAVWTGSEAYIFGGMSYDYGFTYFDDIIRYDPATDILTMMPNTLPETLCDTSAIWDTRYSPPSAYIFGGRGENGESDGIIRYVPAYQDIGYMLCRLPSERYGTSAVYDGYYAYIIGGFSSSPYSYFDSILRYDTTHDTIEELTTPLPSPRAYTSAVYIPPDNDIYVFGGKNVAGAVEEVVRIDLDTTPITVETYPFSIILPGSTSGPQWSFSAVWDSNWNNERYVYLFGGYGLGYDYCSDLIIRFDLTTRTTAYTCLCLPTWKGSPSAVWNDGQGVAYVFGGYYFEPQGDPVVEYHPNSYP